MKSSRIQVCICLDGAQVSAVCTETARTGEVTLKAAIRTSLQSLLESDRAKASADLRKALDNANIPKGPVCLAVPRHQIILKHLVINRGELPDAELAPMVRLQIAREGTINLEKTLTDYTVLNPESDSASILVAAADQDRINRLRDILSGAGRKIASLRMRTDGLVSFVDSESPALVIAPNSAGCEFAVIQDGRAVYSRATQDALTPAQIQIEADRTQISSRTVDPNLSQLSTLLVSQSKVGFPEDWDHVVSPPAHPSILNGFDSTNAPDLPLLGLATEDPSHHRIDFANPHKPADRNAPARQKAMLVAFTLIAMVGTSFVLGTSKVNQLESAVESASIARDTAFKSYLEGLVEQARYQHESTWINARVDWSGHLEQLIRALPEPGSLILDEISARADTQIVFRDGGKSPLPGKWGSKHRILLNISGSADSRETIESLRETLLTKEGCTLSINGADTENKFSLELVSSLASPKGSSQ